MGKAVFSVLFGLLAIHYINSAPNDVKLEDIANVAKAEEKLDEKTLLDETPEDTTIPQNQRHKRWYNYFGFPPVNGFPPFNPGYFNGGESLTPGGFAPQDPLVLIHRRLQDISNSFRQPPPPQIPPGFSHFPGFVPIFFIPQVGCACTPDDTTQRPNSNQPTPPNDDNNQNSTDNPGVNSRWPEMEDERQNWGFVRDDNQNINDDEGDGSRPISFDPISPDRPMSRPAPPVEHGSVEGNDNSGSSGSTTTTTSRPNQRPSTPGLQPPTNCDNAILRCCQLPQITLECFAYQGCPDPSAYGNPCDPGVISRVIDRFLKFYRQRNG